ncbi:PREDICTED: centrosomal protein of 135 kDa-like isoform X2 [Nicrophorus vespilloides]|uniref:Centrosomal protein of 135 kDa-like isoform X2 n=1 Tax=Nicrophorus vespilloides TaxID=110193 RepID=A0ABM1M0B9_NICVS|nr:PREDICTED: centrosomal protein of 135 kDa-like isoform X2 [Nicrophorus vespilloides]
MEERYENVCRQLLDLGYKYTLNPDCLLLVEKLLADLIETTENLRKYMGIAKDALQERDNLRFGAEPYKCDNAKLMKECNDLHLDILRQREESEKQKKDLRKKVLSLEGEKRDLLENERKLKERIREMEKRPRSSTVSLTAQTGKKCDSSRINSAMALADQQRAYLTREVNRLKDQHLELTEINDDLRKKLINREKEIGRLGNLLQGGRPQEVLNGDCCYQDINVKLLNKQDEINSLYKEKMELEIKLKDSRCKQHDAMKHALHLAERNSVLEKELKDIDQMALAVEEECNTTVKNNSKKVSRLQEKMHNTMIELQRVEKLVMDLKHEKESLIADVEAVKIEKRHLQSVLTTALDDKKRLTDKINKFSIIEKDLNLEIDRLVRESAEHKRTIAELKGHCISEHYAMGTLDSDQNHRRQRSPPKSPNKKSKSPKRHNKTSPTRKTIESYSRNADLYSDDKRIPSPLDSDSVNDWIKDPRMCVSKLKSMIDEELDRRYPHKTNSVDRLRNERDFYIKEYQHLVEQFKNVYKTQDVQHKTHDVQFVPTNSDSNLMKRINELDNLILQLRQENQVLAKEKHNLMLRLENSQDCTDSVDYLSLKRLERERDLLRADIDKLEDEKHAIKERLKATSELHTNEVDKYKLMLKESEKTIRLHEMEKRDLVQNQGSRRTTIASLEDQLDVLKGQLKNTNEELTEMRTAYNQLKILNEQTDKALKDSQRQLNESENQLESYQRNINASGDNVATLQREIDALKKDVQVLRQNLVELDREKDNLLLKLDEKTERIVALENDLASKDSRIRSLEDGVSEFKNKVTTTLEEKNSREFQLKSVSSEVGNLRLELQTLTRSRDSLLLENRRLQDDLAACTASCRSSNAELEIAKRQVQDLKTQLQHYVAEIKRIEDMMTSKEIERSEMLDQFRNLSHEATMLETNNHSLETQATESKLQLSVALDHASDLETHIQDQTEMIKSYERQINELTSQIANLEMKLKMSTNQQERMESELVSVKEMYSRVEKQKDDLLEQLQEQEGLKSQTQRELGRFKRDSEILQKTLSRDQDRVDNLEKLLNENRQEAVDQRLINEDLQSEISRLNKELEDLHRKLVVIQELTTDVPLDVISKSKSKSLPHVISQSKSVSENLASSNVLNVSSRRNVSSAARSSRSHDLKEENKENKPHRPFSPVYNLNVRFAKCDCDRGSNFVCKEHEKYECNAHINIEDFSDVE